METAVQLDAPRNSNRVEREDASERARSVKGLEGAPGVEDGEIRGKLAARGRLRQQIVSRRNRLPPAGIGVEPLEVLVGIRREVREIDDALRGRPVAGRGKPAVLHW